jgi:hypothetical protein
MDGRSGAWLIICYSESIISLASKMLAHRLAYRKAHRSPPRPAPATNQVSWSQAAQAQARGFARFSELNTSQRRIASLPSASRSPSNTPPTSSVSLPSSCRTSVVSSLVGSRQPTPMLTEEEEQERDIRAVRSALFRYREEPLVQEMGPLDLVRWWDVRMFIKSALSSITHFVTGARKGAPPPFCRGS